eukprot:TRINITY_DN861_c0_g1_i14.p1 TRINITY_DN861_c0_g1~~TRINITY_DN861_c0_g1_i14.p1  ORF type:complete len:346 (-),score=81.62 TRINITY_DN861_c0_g1_i14:109-1146(-)
MKTKKCGQNSLKLTSMMTQKRKHLKCASYIKKQKEFLRENYHYNLGKKRFPKTNFEKYETNRLIFCKMNIPEQIKETQGRVDHFIAEIKVWNRENKEELRYWNQEKKDARKSGIEEDLKNAREELNSLKNDKKVLETQRDIAISRLNELEKSMKENKKRKVFYKLNSADTQNLVWLGAQTNCRRFVDSFQKQYKAQHARFAASNLQKRNNEEHHQNHAIPIGSFGCELDIEKKTFEQTLEHMKSGCNCHKTFRKIFQEKRYEMPSDLDGATIKAWKDLSNVLHGDVTSLDGGVLLIPSDFDPAQKRVLAKLASVVGYNPRVIRTDCECRDFDDDELLTPEKRGRV